MTFDKCYFPFKIKIFSLPSSDMGNCRSIILRISFIWILLEYYSSNFNETKIFLLIKYYKYSKITTIKLHKKLEEEIFKQYILKVNVNMIGRFQETIFWGKLEVIFHFLKTYAKEAS